MPALWLLLLALAALVVVIAVIAVLMFRQGAGDGGSDENLARAWELLERKPAAALRLFDGVVRATQGKAARRHAQAQLGRALCLLRLSREDEAADAQEAALEDDL